MRSPRRWPLPDLLDLEYFLDRAEKDDHNHRQGNETALPLTVDNPGADLEDSILLARWLAACRARAGRRPTPGRILAEGLRIGYLLIPLLSLAAGWSGMAGFLHYTGRTPVNVSLFFLVFILSQLLILAVMAGSVGFSRLIRHDPLPLSGRFLRWLVTILGRRLTGSGLDRARERALDLHHLLRRLGRSYGILPLLPFFRLVQTAGVFFNLGLLAGFLTRIATSDLAFGWQSTLRLGAETVYGVARCLAWPWSWLLGPGRGWPTLDQVRGSQMVLKEGITHLATGDLVAWWPFLALSLAVYGLLPRLVLLLGAWWAESLAARRIRFSQARIRLLLRRLRAARDHGPDPVPVRPSEPDPEPEKTATVASVSGPAGAAEAPLPAAPEKERPGPGQTLLLLPAELAALERDQTLESMIRDQCGRSVDQWLTLAEDPEESLATSGSRLAGIDEVYLLQEAWQPPIEELLWLLGRLRSALGPGPAVFLLMTGRPDGSGPLTPPADQDLAIWRNRIRRLADPGLYLLPLVRS